MSRTNPGLCQTGAGHVDRYIGSSFDVVYAVYKILDQLPVIHKFALEYLPEFESLKEELNLKISITEGKQLSDENFTLLEKIKLSSLNNYDDSSVQQAIATKVNKVDGKGLSTNDFTTAHLEDIVALKSAAFVETSTFDTKGSSQQALTNANAYTDDLFTASRTYADNRVSVAFNSANQYTDDQDIIILTEAKSHTNTQITTANQYTDNKDIAARSYTDTKILDLKQHAETLIDSARLYSETQLGTAKSYSDTILQTSKGYSDGLLLTAQSYTNTQIALLDTRFQSIENAITSILGRLDALESVE